MAKNYQKFWTYNRESRIFAQLRSAIFASLFCVSAVSADEATESSPAKDGTASSQLAMDAPQTIRDQLWLAHRDDINAMHEVALYLLDQRSSDDDEMAHYAFGWALYAGRSGHPQASELTGSMYRRGIGVAQNYAKARKWLERALARKSREPNFELALLYADADNPGSDKKKAAQYLTTAIEQSEPRACLISAQSKIEDGATFRSVLTEVTCAAEGGMPEAMEMLGDFNLRQNSPYALVRARKWLRLAAENGSKSAAKKLLELVE
jgi:TPR repeat protein